MIGSKLTRRLDFFKKIKKITFVQTEKEGG